MSSSNDDLVRQLVDSAHHRHEKLKLAKELETRHNCVRTTGDNVELSLRRWDKEQGLAGHKIALGAGRLAALAFDLAKNILAYNDALAAADWGNISDRWQSCPAAGEAGSERADAFEFLRTHLRIAAETGALAEDLGQRMAKAMPFISPAKAWDEFESVLKQWFWNQPFHERDGDQAKTKTDGAACVAIINNEYPHSGAGKHDEAIPAQFPWDDWAVGIIDGLNACLFQRYQGKWRESRTFRLRDDRQMIMLTEIAKAGGDKLPKKAVANLWRHAPKVTEPGFLTRNMPAEVSHLNKALRTVLAPYGLGSVELPIATCRGLDHWPLRIQIGYAVLADEAYLGAKKHYQFSTHKDLHGNE